MAYLQVARAAFRDLWRRHWAAAAVLTVGLGGLLGSMAPGDRSGFSEYLQWGTVFVLVPAMAAAGVGRWVGRGPLGLAGAAGREASTVASYGLGTAVWALPFALLAAATATAPWSPSQTELDLIAMVSLLLSTAGLGAAAGRLVRGTGPAVLAAWALVLATAGLDVAASWALTSVVPWSLLPNAAPGALLALPAASASVAIWVSGKARHATLALGP